MLEIRLMGKPHSSEPIESRICLADLADAALVIVSTSDVACPLVLDCVLRNTQRGSAELQT